MRRWTIWLLLLIGAATALGGGTARQSFAHGTLDQSHTGDPACNATNFVGFVSSGSSLRQEFVPAEPGLAAVALCLNILNPGTQVTVNIRTGTAAAPSAIIATSSANAAAAGFQYLHLDLADVEQVIPGTKYVIELPSSATFQWRATCATIGGSCVALDPDGYVPGTSNQSDGRDFAFRTLSGELAIPPTGTSDQELAGDPDCGPGVFRGFTASGGPIRQEFVPAAAGLSAVDLCINVTGASAGVTVNIRGGTAAAPSAILQTDAGTAGPGYQWFRVTIDPILETTPGTKYVIELPSSSDFQWLGKCGAVSGSCTSIDPDAYPPGVSTRAGGADFGFRTIAGSIAGVPPTGTADQKLTGDPGCGPVEFRGFTASAGATRQEFVPTAAGLAAIDLCINVLDASELVTVNIRSGTAAAPGAILQTESATASGPGYRWFRVPIDPILATTPTTKYVIELPSSANFQWRAKCGEVSGSCTSIDPDAYPPGVSTRVGGADFGFRTIAGTAPGAPSGTADQKLTGDPACSEANFKGFGSSAGPLRQEFVPVGTARGLDAVDLCLNIATAGTVVTLNVRTGTAQAPGPIIGTVNATAAGVGFQFLRFDLPSVVPTLGGTKYVLEVPASASFQWRGTCGTVAGTCLAIDADAYPPGVTNLAAIGDFGFRTILGTPVMRALPMVASDGVILN
ncbi:MAG: hypothetical protein ACKVT1_17410 [Dehalococcoidia bacterium]